MAQKLVGLMLVLIAGIGMANATAAIVFAAGAGIGTLIVCALWYAGLPTLAAVAGTAAFACSGVLTWFVRSILRR